MRESLVLRQQLSDSIDQEIATRTKVHQGRIARIKGVKARMLATSAPPVATPLVMLAHGDSWFDYPLSGNDLSLSDTDVIAQLRPMGNPNPVILNVSHHGDASTDELSWPKQQRMIDALSDPANWMDNGRPDAILFSGGGNDIAGDQFCIFLNYASPGVAGLNSKRFQDALGMIEASYLDLFAFRDRNAQGVPVFGHCYDFPIPNGVHPVCVGPWLKPSLDYCGFNNVNDGTAIARQAMTEFKDLLVRLSSAPTNNFIVILTQGLLNADDWANELHPYPDGFKKIAGAFVKSLRSKFPGRI